ncbi:hypothetical protein HDF16_001506 [Granulicella aggregans]|uniref:TIR domain-containing protein n=1 Tax=Granulicella aggregans TaxID=474949 RepID=A0A7W8E2X0_9BACT|nr:toll/interleukin-1 receptor domain-containing protein [Granulicella aggregans]MBB5056821.1 hypothetical protein [Granulicella aggregans]
MADAIFISYRRDDSEGEAGRLFDDLTRAFGSEAVFMDVAGIKPGVDFRRAIEQNVASCGVLLAMIGPRWLSTANSEGARRLDDPNDFVALEIASAMKRDVPVIPVLVHEATMPAVDKLPESLKDLAFHNSVELSHARWNSDVGLLIEALKAYVTQSPSAQTAVVHATVPVQLPAPHPPGDVSRPAADGSKTPLIAGIALVTLAVAGGMAYLAMRPSAAPKPVDSTPVTGAANPANNPSGAASAATSSDAPATTPVQARTMTASVSVTAADGRPETLPAKTPGPGDSYVGTWRRSVSAGNGDTLGLLAFSKAGDGLTIHAFGSCQAPVCDWGSQPAVGDGDNMTATFSPKPSGSDTSRTVRVTTHLVPEGLDVMIQNSFESPAGTRHSSAHTLFLKVN